MAMPWLAMTGVFLSVRRGTVIRIDFFFEKIPNRLQATVAYLGYGLNIVVLGFMALVSLQLCSFSAAMSRCMPTFRLGSQLRHWLQAPPVPAMAYAAEFFREWRDRQRAKGNGGAAT